jgi:uncharacterized protein (DUF1015 family)
MEKNQLLCTFTTKTKLKHIVGQITETYTILFGKIFVLKEDITPEDNKLLCTYNIDISENDSSVLPNTISLHRKKETNTLYTINGLNELIRLLNDGELDKNFPITWQNYRNTLILSDENGLRKVKTKISTIIKL